MLTLDGMTWATFDISKVSKYCSHALCSPTVCQPLWNSRPPPLRWWWSDGWWDRTQRSWIRLNHDLQQTKFCTAVFLLFDNSITTHKQHCKVGKNISKMVSFICREGVPGKVCFHLFLWPSILSWLSEKSRILSSDYGIIRCSQVNPYQSTQSDFKMRGRCRVCRPVIIAYSRTWTVPCGVSTASSGLSLL